MLLWVSVKTYQLSLFSSQVSISVLAMCLRTSRSVYGSCDIFVKLSIAVCVRHAGRKLFREIELAITKTASQLAKFRCPPMLPTDPTDPADPHHNMPRLAQTCIVSSHS